MSIDIQHATEKLERYLGIANVAIEHIHTGSVPDPVLSQITGVTGIKLGDHNLYRLTLGFDHALTQQDMASLNQKLATCWGMPDGTHIMGMFRQPAHETADSLCLQMPEHELERLLGCAEGGISA
jgi:hypothetical protein